MQSRIDLFAPVPAAVLRVMHAGSVHTKTRFSYLLFLLVFLPGCAFNSPAPYRYTDSSIATASSAGVVAFLRRAPTGQPNTAWKDVWVMKDTGEGARQVSGIKSYATPMWSESGRFLLVYSQGLARGTLVNLFPSTRLALIAIDTGEHRDVSPPASGAKCLAVVDERDTIYWHYNNSLIRTSISGDTVEYVGRFSPDGKGNHNWERAVFVSRYKVHDRDGEIIALNLHTREYRHVATGILLDFAHDGSRIAMTLPGTQEIRILSFEGERQNTFEMPSSAQVRSARFSAAGDALYFSTLTQSVPGRRGFARVDLTTGLHRDICLDPMYFNDYRISSDGRRVICVGGERTDMGVYLGDTVECEWTRVFPRSWTAAASSEPIQIEGR